MQRSGTGPGGLPDGQKALGILAAAAVRVVSRGGCLRGGSGRLLMLSRAVVFCYHFATQLDGTR